MFWNFMNQVHGLPTFEDKDKGPWWTEEEQKNLDFIQGQLSYVDNGVPTLVQEMGLTPESEGYWEWTCIYPVYENVDGELVLGLHKNWSEFLTKHLDIGKYLGAATYDLWDHPFICYKCGEGIDIEDAYENDPPEGFLIDMEGIGRSFDGTIDQTVAGKANCPCCGAECELAAFEENGDVNTVWVFEKASVAYCHYGRGAGLSFKFHTSLDMKGKEPFEYFKDLIGELDQ